MCDCDAAVMGIGDQFLARMGQHQEAETKENPDGRYCDNAKRDKVEQSADIGFQRPDALIRRIGALTRYLRGLGVRGLGRVSPRNLSWQRI